MERIQYIFRIISTQKNNRMDEIYFQELEHQIMLFNMPQEHIGKWKLNGAF